MSRSIRGAIFAIALFWSCPHPLAAFSVFDGIGASAPEVASDAARWSAEPIPVFGSGLHDGIQVAVDPTFLTDLGVPQVADLYGVSEATADALAESAVRAAFRMWETPVLHFDIHFPGPTVEGSFEGMEIDLFARPDPDVFFGFTSATFGPEEDRRLTNGQRVPGEVFAGADIFINTTRILEGATILHDNGVPLNLVAAALQILIGHEIGHAIGLGHPNEGLFLDTDTDPYNAMVINPIDPFSGLFFSSIPPDPPGQYLPIMWGGVSSEDPNDLLALTYRLFNPVLTDDDRGGRDVLYPSVPFICYRAGKSKGTARFTPVDGAQVDDAFEDATLDVRRPVALCNAVAIGTDAGAVNYAEHFVRYATRRPRGTGRFARVDGQQITDRFGSATLVNVVGSGDLQAPGAAMLGATPSPISDPFHDHFSCHRVVSARGAPRFQPVRNLQLRDELGSLQVDVLRPTRLCAPAVYNGADAGAESHYTHLMCYRIRPSRGQPRFTRQGPYSVEDANGAQTLNVVRPAELCVPAERNP